MRIINNEKGGILYFVFTRANVDDRIPLKKTEDFTKMYLERYSQPEDIYHRICLTIICGRDTSDYQNQKKYEDLIEVLKDKI